MNENETNKKTSPSVALFSDPYGFTTNDVADAQNKEDDFSFLQEEENESLESLHENDTENNLENDLENTVNDSETFSHELLEDNLENYKEEQNEENLDLDADVDPISISDLRAADAMLSKLEEKLEEESKVQEQQHEEATLLQAQEDAALLAKQIAEDVALNEYLSQSAENADSQGLDPELSSALPKIPSLNENGERDLAELESCIESILFMTDKPISKNRLQELLGVEMAPEIATQLFEDAIDSLIKRYQKPHHGFEVAEVAGGYQFRTKLIRAPLAKRLAKVQTQRLSAGAMETLAIVAYKQPALKDEIDKVRGVDSSHFIRTLMDKRLISISGRSELPGKPLLYSTTSEFLELFGLSDIQALPALREIEQMIPQSENNQKDEDPRVREMRKMVHQMKVDVSTTLDYDPREDERILQEIRTQVGSISVSTPYLEEQKMMEKEAQLAAKQAQLAAAALNATPELPLE